LSNFAKLKKSDDLDFLSEKVQNAFSGKTGGFAKDERLWYPETDKMGNGYAVIRFLPAPDCDGDKAVPFIQRWEFFWKGQGGWYIENCLNSIGASDPCTDFNSKLWAAGEGKKNSPERDQASRQKRKLYFYSNVYIIDDPKNPENNGRVVLYRYGKKVFAKINEAMHPSFPDKAKFNPFHLFNGANFKLKIRKLDGFPNYDLSEFDGNTPLFNDEAKMEAVYNQCHSLQALMAPDQFKDYATLQANLSRALGDGGLPVAAPSIAAAGNYPGSPPGASTLGGTKAVTPPWEDEDGDEDPKLSRFQDLANRR
jgi:hypothetical protein